MERKAPSGIMVATLLIMAFMGLDVRLSFESFSTTKVCVDPPIFSTFKGATFNVDVVIKNVTLLYGFEYKFFWNTMILDLVNVNLTLPWPRLGFISRNETQENYNVTHGMYWLSATGHPANPFDGTTTVTELSFKAVEVGNSALTLSETKLANPLNQPIAHDVGNGYVQVLQAVLGDINYDGIVDINDVIIWGKAFGSKPEDPKWNPQADLYQDNFIDIFDGVIISQNYGKTHP